MNSMTGFASRIISLPLDEHTTASATLTLKTVNGRFFDITCKMPSSCARLEVTIVQQCRAALQRGTVTFSLQSSQPLTIKSTVMPSYALAQGYIAAINDLQKTLNIPGQLSIQDILLIPNVFESIETPLSEPTAHLILQEIEALITEVVREREREGTALYNDFMQHVQIIEKALEYITPRALEVSEQRIAQVVKLIQEPLNTLTEDARTSHLQAIYQNIGKIEINEELVRFTTHIAALKDTFVAKHEPQGKRIDFILQEMFREINTLNAKLIDAPSFEHIIAIKTSLERMREQAQNIV